VFAVLAVANASYQLDDGTMQFVGGIIGAVVLGVGVGLLVRWVYFRFLDPAPRAMRSPWVLVIGSVCLFASAGGQAARQKDEDRKLVAKSVSGCRDEPASELLRDPPRGLSYALPPPEFKQRFDRLSAARPELPPLYTLRIVMRRGVDTGTVMLVATSDIEGTLKGLLEGARDFGAPVDRDGARFGGRTWTVIDYGQQRAYFTPFGCRLVGAMSSDDRVARAVASSITRDK
jgi:hypothetical protein